MNYQDQRPDERVLGADTIRVEAADGPYDEALSLYRFIALRGSEILDIVELLADDWSLREATNYVCNDRWLSAQSAELCITEAAQAVARRRRA